MAALRWLAKASAQMLRLTADVIDPPSVRPTLEVDGRVCVSRDGRWVATG